MYIVYMHTTNLINTLCVKHLYVGVCVESILFLKIAQPLRLSFFLCECAVFSSQK